MPSPFFVAIKPRSARLMLSAALAAASVALLGCGANNPTTRTSSSGSNSTPEPATFQLTLQSPVRLTNIEARVIDAASGQIVHQSIISNDHRLNVNINRADARSQRLLYVELRPSALNQSRYYDPILDRDAPFNQPLRAILQSAASNQSILIDPYSEIAFQRAQVRSGWLNNRADTTQLGLITVNALRAAQSEVAAVFNVRSVTLPQGLSSRTDLQRLNVTANQTRVLDYFRFSLGHAQYYVQQQGNNIDAPYLAFSQKAAIDMLDGDLDGLTLHGFGDQAEIFLNSPLVQPIINNNPERNQHLLLAEDQLPARRTYNVGVGDTIKQFFEPLFPSGSAEFKLINDYDYLNMSTRTTPTPPRPFALHSPGGGNYTRAFGLMDGQLVKNFINADDTGLVNDIAQNDIAQIAGIYQNPQGCRLVIQPNGKVTLTQGTQTAEADIDRNFGDSMSRADADSQSYLINITTPSDSTPSFLQIRTDGARVLFAQSGRSLLEMPSTEQLSAVDLRCDFTSSGVV